MSRYFLFPFICLSLCLISCEEDHDEECHECHVALVECCGATEPHEPGEHEVEIGEFCGDDLVNVEANGFVVTESFDHDGVTYEIGHAFPSSMVHCEEHADHDH